MEEKAPATVDDLDKPYLTPEPVRPSTRYPADSATMPHQEAPSGRSALAKVIGVALVAGVAIFWVLLIIGIVTDSTVDAGYAIELLVGGVILSAIPFALGVYALRRGYRG